MNVKVLIAGAILELGYLVYLVFGAIPEFNITPMFLEFSKHVLFQVVVLAIILVGAFVNGKTKLKEKGK